MTASLLRNGPHGYHVILARVNTPNEQRKSSLFLFAGAMLDVQRIFVDLVFELIKIKVLHFATI